jgi:lysozyme
MQMSDTGNKWLAGLEGSKNTMYKDVAGLPTIGVGHLLTKDELYSGKIEIGGQSVKWAGGLSPDQVITLFAQDVKPFGQGVARLVRIPLKQNEFDALVSLVFNIGIGAFANSTLLTFLNAGKSELIPYQWKRWNMAAGRRIEGLAKRRERELAMYLHGQT